MATCPRCGKKMMQEAEACDLCWLKSDLSQAEKHIAELEIRAENAERKRDEAKARAAKAEAARLDADLQVARDQKRIAELERGRCADCGATLTLDGCVLCGAPVCCPQCCQIQSLTERARKAERERDEARKRVAELEDVNLAARRRLESLEVSMGEKMPLGAHAALSCLREKGGA